MSLSSNVSTHLAVEMRLEIDEQATVANRFTQDGENFLTFGALSDTTANTAAVATATAATVTNQSGIAAVNANIASILSGSSALETLNVSNETVGWKNTVAIENKSASQHRSCQEIEHHRTIRCTQPLLSYLSGYRR